MQRIPIIRLEGEEADSLVKVLDQVSSWSRAPKLAPYLIFGLIVLAWVSGNIVGILLFLQCFDCRACWKPSSLPGWFGECGRASISSVLGSFPSRHTLCLDL